MSLHASHVCLGKHFSNDLSYFEVLYQKLAKNEPFLKFVNIFHQFPQTKYLAICILIPAINLSCLSPILHYLLLISAFELFTFSLMIFDFFSVNILPFSENGFRTTFCQNYVFFSESCFILRKKWELIVKGTLMQI